MDIVETIKQADFDILNVLRTSCNFTSSLAFFSEYQSVELRYDLSNQYGNTSIQDLLAHSKQTVETARDHLSGLHPLEAKLVEGKLKEILNKVELVEHAGQGEASTIAHKLYGFPTDSSDWFNDLYAELQQATESTQSSVSLPQRTTYNHFHNYLGTILDDLNLDMPILPQDSSQCTFDRSNGSLNIPTSRSFYADRPLVKLAVITGPHEIGHALSYYNGTQHPSNVVKAVFSQGTNQYSTTEEGRQKAWQINRIRRLSQLAPHILSSEQAEQIVRGELLASLGHFTAYNFRKEGFSNSEIYYKLTDEVGLAPRRAANTTLRCGLGMPDRNAFPGFLVYFAGLSSYMNLSQTQPDKELLLQNGAMHISYVGSGLYEQLVSAGLANEQPAIQYDQDVILERAIAFIESQ